MTWGDFRTLQALADLQALARETAPTLGQAAVRVAAKGCALEADEDGIACLEAAELAAADPEALGFVAGTAILLADCLRGGLSPDSLAKTHASAEAYAGVPPHPRAVLLTGFREARRFAHQPGYDVPDPAHLIATDRQAINDALVTIARSLTQDDLVQISRADYDYGAEEHLSALKDLLRTLDDGQVHARDWEPWEVISLTSHVPAEPWFPQTTALMLLDAMAGTDRLQKMEFRWQSNATHYCAMPEQYAAPFLAAFRHLYETVDDWDPYWEYQSALGERALVIPPAAPAFLKGARDA
ncbi:MAG: hypothetical protein AAGK00_08805 [Pseudomonadota bacterium]